MANGAALSNYLENAIINHFLKGGAAVAQPAGLYLGLFTDATGIANDQPTTEVTGNGYARIPVTFGAAASGSTSNTADASFAAATGPWGTVNYVGVFDAATGGNLLVWTALTTSKTIGNTDVFKFNASSLSVTLD
jgi:hypothetical protein